MSRYGDLYRVFQGSIGQNLDNDQDHIINIKNKLAFLGRYQDEYKSGFIDAVLDRGIRQYQRDRNLKSDGVIYPGGETEATILGEMIDPKRTEQDVKMAFAPAAVAIPAAKVISPWFIRGAGAVGGAILGQETWEAMDSSERQDEIDKMCDEQFEEDMRDCSKLPAKNGRSKAEVFKICSQTAMQRYARCRVGQNDDKGPLYNG